MTLSKLSISSPSSLSPQEVFPPSKAMQEWRALRHRHASIMRLAEPQATDLTQSSEAGRRDSNTQGEQEFKYDKDPFPVS